MAKRLSSFWKEFPELEQTLEASEWTASGVSASLSLAIALGIASPALPLTVAGLAFVSPLKKIAEIALRRKDNALTLEEIVAVAAPLAYLESYDYWISNNDILRQKLEKNDIERIGVDERSTISVNPIISNLVLSRDIAIRAISNFEESAIGKAFNTVLLHHLSANGLDGTEAKIISRWVCWKSKTVLRKTIEDIQTHNKVNIVDSDIDLLNIYALASEQDEQCICSNITRYLDKVIAAAPKAPVFDESFNVEDIYVSLKIRSTDLDGNIEAGADEKEVEEWAKSLLQNSEKSKQVMFIQGGPGRGKTVFCRIFCDWIRKHFHPLWIPIFIRLRDIESFDNIFENTLSAAVKQPFSKDKRWLRSSDLRFLFIFDGFDELRLEGRARGGIEKFIKQLASFQENYNSTEERHRFIVTGRQLALQGISYLPDNLERVEFIAMDDELQKLWLDKWQALNPEISEQGVESFESFLSSNKVPLEVREELSREPLLLYLLAAMHRDEDTSISELTGKNRIENKISIYERALNWVLTKQRKRAIQKEIIPLEVYELKQILVEAGLAVTQSGGESAKITTIERQLSEWRPAIAKKLERIRREKDDDALKNALSTFYLKPKFENEDNDRFEFFHTSFGEFFCAKRIQQSINRWAKWDDDTDYFSVKDEEFYAEMYSTFGYGGLTQEIVEYLFGLIDIDKKGNLFLERLFARLENFYQRWCDGKFIDAEGTTFSQKMMNRLKKDLPNQNLYLGQHEVEVFTVLNALILILELQRFCKRSDGELPVISFHPCGRRKVKRNSDEDIDQTKDVYEIQDKDRLLHIIGLSHCLGADGFTKTIGANLSGVDLSGANLSGVDLSGANLSKANLANTSLRQSNLTDANLTGAELSESDMCRCDLTGANLEKAFLTNAYLRGADCRNARFLQAKLEGTDLCRAYLYNTDFSQAIFLNASVRNASLFSANFEEADFRELSWNTGTSFLHSQGLHKVRHAPERLRASLEFQDAIQLSIAYEKIYLGDISSALSECEAVAEAITKRVKDSDYKARIYNRFAWLCSLLMPRDMEKKNIEECRQKIFFLANEATKLNPKSGNYKDTLAIAYILYPRYYMPQPFESVGDGGQDEEYIARENPYQFAIELLLETLECEDFKRLALPDMERIRQRRKNWIEELRERKNPLNEKEIALLLKEEY
ncbi:MAG: pentapeptide repeat-containing protein [Cyanobacteria bacterium J06614_10]